MNRDKKEEPMKSEWRLQANFIQGELWYLPYRIRDTSEPVHGGECGVPGRR